MGQVFIPEPIAISPQSLNQAEDFFRQNPDIGRLDYYDLEGDYPSNPAIAGNGYTSNSRPSNRYPDVTPGPVPQNPGYERLVAILQNTLTQDWAERGNPGNPRILQCYEVCNLSYTSDTGDPSRYWCSAFVSWALEEAGIDSKQTMGSQLWYDWGAEVAGWRGGDYSQIRKYDVVIFKAKDRDGGHIGFADSIADNGKINIHGGNQGDTVKVSSYWWDDPRPDEGLYVTSIKRNWALPEDADIPLPGAAAAGTATTT